MTTATTGTGTITLGSAITGLLTFALAGVSNGETITYAIKDGNNSEIGRGVYTSSGTTLTRTVLKSTNSDAAINLSGAAEVRIVAASEDIYLRDWVTEYTTYSSHSANTIPVDDTIPQVTEGDQIISMTLTPQTTFIEVEALVNVGFASNDNRMTVAIFKDGAANAVASGIGFIASSYLVATPITVKKRIAVTPGVSTTLTVRVGTHQNTYTGYINGNSVTRYFGGTMASFLRAREIRPGN